MKITIKNIASVILLLTCTSHSLNAMENFRKRPLDGDNLASDAKKPKISQGSSKADSLSEIIRLMGQVKGTISREARGQMRVGYLPLGSAELIKKAIDLLLEYFGSVERPDEIFVESLQLLFEMKAACSMPEAKKIDKKADAIIRNLAKLRASLLKKPQENASMVPFKLEAEASLLSRTLYLLLRAEGVYHQLKQNQHACALFMMQEAQKNLENAAYILSSAGENGLYWEEKFDGQGIMQLNCALNYLLGSLTLRGISETQMDADETLREAIHILSNLHENPQAVLGPAQIEIEQPDDTLPMIDERGPLNACAISHYEPTYESISDFLPTIEDQGSTKVSEIFSNEPVFESTTYDTAQLPAHTWGSPYAHFPGSYPIPHANDQTRALHRLPPPSKMSVPSHYGPTAVPAPLQKRISLVGAYFQQSPNLKYENCMLAPTKGVGSLSNISKGFLGLDSTVEHDLRRDALNTIYVMKLQGKRLWYGNLYVYYDAKGICYPLVKTKSTSDEVSPHAEHNFQVLAQLVKKFYGERYEMMDSHSQITDFSDKIMGLQVPGANTTFPIMFTSPAMLKSRVTIPKIKEALEFAVGRCEPELLKYPNIFECTNGKQSKKAITNKLFYIDLP